MLKLLYFIISTVLIATPAWASPFLVCDPYPATDFQPTEYLLQWDGSMIWISSPPEGLADEGVRLKFDLVDVSSGSHSVKVKAKNKWTESTAVPFSFVK